MSGDHVTKAVQAQINEQTHCLLNSLGHLLYTFAWLFSKVSCNDTLGAVKMFVGNGSHIMFSFLFNRPNNHEYVTVKEDGDL